MSSASVARWGTSSIMAILDHDRRNVSIPFAPTRCPPTRPPHTTQVDTVEQGDELSGVECDRAGQSIDARHAKPTLLQALVIQDEAAAVPREHLHPVAAARDEHVEMAVVDVAAKSAHLGRQAVKPLRMSVGAVDRNTRTDEGRFSMSRARRRATLPVADR